MEERYFFTVEDDISADEAVEAIRELQEEVDRLENITKARKELLQEATERKTAPLKEELDSLEIQLKEYFKTLKTKDTKTQRKYILPSGDLLEKKQAPEFELDNDELLEWAKTNNEKYYTTKETPAWTAIKADLEFKGGFAIHKETGEIVYSVTVKEREPKFIIKY